MSRPRKRLPGESNPTASSEGPDAVARSSWMAQGSHGPGSDQGIGHAIGAFIDWVRERRDRKQRRRPHGHD